MENKAWKYNNTLLKENQFTQYEYWDTLIPFEQLYEIKDDPQKLYDTIFKYLREDKYNSHVADYFDPEDEENIPSILGCANEVLKRGVETPVRVYRGLLLPEGKETDRENLGSCWSWSLESVKDFNYGLYLRMEGEYSSSNGVIFYGTTPRDNIDWAESIYLHSLCPEECELRVINTKKIQVDKTLKSPLLHSPDDYLKWSKTF